MEVINLKIHAVIDPSWIWFFIGILVLSLLIPVIFRIVGHFKTKSLTKHVDEQLKKIREEKQNKTVNKEK